MISALHITYVATAKQDVPYPDRPRIPNQSDTVSAKTNKNKVLTGQSQSPDRYRTEEILTNQSPEKLDPDDEKLDGIVKIETLDSEEITELKPTSDNEEDFHLGNKNGRIKILFRPVFFRPKKNCRLFSNYF